MSANHVKTTSKRELLKNFPSLHFGIWKNWFVVVSPEQDICALALNTFPQPEQILNRFQKHALSKTTINLPEAPSLLLAGTPLQLKVWQALLDIPAGKTWSYQQLANYVQHPKAVRAVANAVGANPISPLIPCHRIIRNDGSIGGYFWGLQAKLDLLKKEGVNITHIEKSLRAA